MTSTSSGSPSATPDLPAVARQHLGPWGEALAAAHYAELGYVVLAHNWRCPAGELDLVVTPRRPGGPVVFVEVKTRRSPAFGTPLEAVTAVKQRRTRRAAAAWLAGRSGATGAAVGGTMDRGDRIRRGAELRFDVVGIVRHPDGTVEIERVEGAF